MSTGGFVAVDDIGHWCRGWLAPTPGFMQRASHVLIDREGVAWIIDPVDCPLLDDAVGDHTVAGVVQLMERHNRDSEAVAARLDVPLLRVPDTGEGTPFTVIPVVDAARIGWHEVALWWPERDTMVVADALGTTGYHCRPGERVGVHPILRVARPPWRLAGYPVRHLVCGHGAGVHGEGTGVAIDAAVRGARRGVPALAGRIAREAVGALTSRRR